MQVEDREANRVTSHSFIYGRPVRGEEFSNRERELRSLFDRLRTGQSAAVFGDPHIGKSSLLLKLADEETGQEYLGDDAQRWMICYLDLQSIGGDYGPTLFWEDALEAVREQLDDTEAVRRMDEVERSDRQGRPLTRLFKHLAQKAQVLVLLLDEVERLLTHPNFQEPSFFTQLRSLATTTGGLALVTASRLSVTQMSEQSPELLEIGSPFFNHMTTEQLCPFDDRAADALLLRAGEAFSSEDRRFIFRVAGGHPYLLQAMAAALVETTGDDRHACAAERFYERIADHFKELWRTLHSDTSRTAVIILALVELGQRALGWDFAIEEIDLLEVEREGTFSGALGELRNRGLADRVGESWPFDRTHLLKWKGERWTLRSQAFAWWIFDVVVARERPLRDYDEWLEERAFRCLLSQEQWDWMTKAVRGASELRQQGIGGLAQALYREVSQGS
jgi:hypothetical protein